MSSVFWPERTVSQIKQPLKPDSEIHSQTGDLLMGQRIDQFCEDLHQMSDIASTANSPRRPASIAHSAGQLA
jgi:hypothetical protein